MKHTELNILAFLEGSGVLLIQLLAAQMLAPQFGAGLISWGVVLGTSSAGLALGYLYGAHLCPKMQKSTIFWMGLFGSSAITLMPATAKILIYTLQNTDPISGSIVVCIFLILPPVILLSSLPILIINCKTNNTNKSGKNTGITYSVSTIGGIFGVMIAGFYSIPTWGLTITAIFAGSIIGLFCIFHLLKQNQRKVFFAIALLPLLYIEYNHNNKSSILHHSEGLMGQITVMDLEQSDTRGLFVNRMGQTLINTKTNKSEWKYPKHIHQITKDLSENSKILLLGLGGGTIANQLLQYKTHQITAIELDSRIPLLANRYFNLSEKVTTIIDDGRHYLEKTSNKFDLIIFDVFKGETPPHQLLTIESFSKAISLLNEKGFIIVNYNGYIKGEKGKATRAIFHTLRNTGLYTKGITTGPVESTSNCLFICSKTTEVPHLNLIGKSNNNAILIDENDLTEASNPKLLTDDIPNLEILNLEAAKEWRKGYSETYYRKNSKKISLFY